MRTLLGPVRAVVVIHRGEADAAAKRWKKPVVVVPHAVDRAAVATTTPLDATTPGSVLIVGNLTEHRNAEGLSALLEALVEVDSDAALTITAVSATGVDPTLLAQYPDRLVALGPIDDLRPLYDATRLVCVPATVAWGVKTTILQGWAARRPVVTTVACAATVDAATGDGLLAASDARHLARALVELNGDLEQCGALVARGSALLEERHSDGAVASAVGELVRGLGGR
jgi:Glycosyl transferases group 1